MNSKEHLQDGISFISRRTRADRDNIIHWILDKEDSMRWGMRKRFKGYTRKFIFRLRLIATKHVLVNNRSHHTSKVTYPDKYPF